ncbi:LppP/LprE family lipoprotein [Gordonia spumicola]|nr:LppP/LprE family lipoprotein [Gordonia spumicola]
MNRRALRASIVVTAAALSMTGCAAADQASSVASSRTTTAADVEATSQTTATAATHDQTQVVTTGVTTTRQTPGVTTTQAAMNGSGHGLCFDLNSRLAKDSIESLGNDSNGGQWRISGASNNPLSGGCGLDWLKVDGSGFNDATYTSRVLLFHGGEFVGTVEPHEYSYTSIAGSTLDSVTVKYRWLRASDPFCCPQGGPTMVTASVSNGAVVRQGQFPPAT